MKINTKLVDLILLRRQPYLHRLLIEKKALDIESLKPDLSRFLNELDSIFYTLDFLEKNRLILIERNNSNSTLEIFNGFNSFEKEDEAIFGQMYYYDKFKEKYVMSWRIEMQSGLLAFKNNGYKTDEQLKDNRNFWLAIGVAIGSSAITALLTTLFRNC